MTSYLLGTNTQPSACRLDTDFRASNSGTAHRS